MYLKVRQAAPAAGPELNQASTGPVLELPHCQMLRFADVCRMGIAIEAGALDGLAKSLLSCCH